MSDEPTAEIGGQVMTQAQYDAARYPLLHPDLGPRKKLVDGLSNHHFKWWRKFICSA